MPANDWKERIAALAAQLQKDQKKKKTKVAAATAPSTVEASPPPPPPPDFVLVTNGNVASVRTSEGSALPSKVEQQTIAFTIAIVDVSGSMDAYKEIINRIIAELIARSSNANLPMGQMTIVCFSSSINATIDMSQPYAHNIRHMSGGTSYSTVFRHVAGLVSQRRSAFPDASFNVAFMTDGQDMDSPDYTRQALAELHEQLSGPNDTMTAVFFAANKNYPVPESLHNISRPRISASEIPVMLLQDSKYFSDWLLGALEKSVTRTSLEFSLRDEAGAVHAHHILLNNNGEFMTGSLFFAGTPSKEDIVAQGVLTSAGSSWPCNVMIKKPEPPAPLSKQQIMQLLQTLISDCLRMPASEIPAALTQIQHVVSMAESSEIRAQLTAAELTLLKKTTSDVSLMRTSGSLTSQRVEERRTFNELLSALQFETHLSTGRMRRQARAIQKLDARIADSAGKVTMMVHKLQDALENLQKTYIAANTRPTRSNGGTTSTQNQRPFDALVTLDNIDPCEVVVSLWTGPPVDDAAYMGNVALNMANVRAQPNMHAPWVGLTDWVQLCDANLTSSNSANIGIPVFDHHASQLTDAERQVVKLMAPLLCGLFATAQPMIDHGHVAVSQLFTIIGHTLQTVPDRAEAEKFANVLLPYAWHLYSNLNIETMTTQPIADRFKGDRNCIGTATAWLGFVYCSRQMLPSSHIALTLQQQWKVYKDEVLRGVAKRLHDTSEARNVERLNVFRKQVQDEWSTLLAQTVTTAQPDLRWTDKVTFDAVVKKLVDNSVEPVKPARVDEMLRTLMDGIGSSLKPSHRLAPGVLCSRDAFDCWKAWTDTTLTLGDMHTVVTYSAGNSSGQSISAMDVALGGGLWTTKVQDQFLDLLIDNRNSMSEDQMWHVLLLRPSFQWIGENATLTGFLKDSNLQLLADGTSYPHVREWFKGKVKDQPVSTIIEMLAQTKMVCDSRIQYWFIKDFGAQAYLFALYQGPSEALWYDHRRSSTSSMNQRLSMPGKIVSDNGIARVVDRVEFVKDAHGRPTNVVSKVTFLDGYTIERNIAGGQRNSVTAITLTKQFTASYATFDRVKVIVSTKHDALCGVFDGEGPVIVEPIERRDERKIGLTNIVGYICARYEGHWVLERVYQQTADGKYVDVMARGDLAYFSHSVPPKK